MEKKQEIISLLKKHYGFDSFRPGQETVIDNVLAGRSTVVIMPTGGGKSLCYQLPALVLSGATFVISPLISLMKDQVDALARLGLPATFVNSAIEPSEGAARLEAVRRGEIKILYIAPERFYNRDFLNALTGIEVSLFAVDEAHCISQWGHDFRPSYLKLKEAVERTGRPPVLALTATATPEVRADIIVQLGLKDPEVVVTGFARPNLQFGVIQASESEKPRVVLEAISTVKGQAGIIYTGTRARADQLAQILLENDVEAVVYHAGMDAADRKWVQENFMKGEVKVIVATNAFGLGIDKADVRFVIHYDMPGTVEAYYQEAGRAGRDGRPSFCLMLYNSRDRRLQEFFIKGDNPPPEIVAEVYRLLAGSGNDTVLITYGEILENLGENVPEMAVGTALKILEREGYIRRARERAGNAYLKATAGLAKIIDSLGARSKSQISLISKLDERFGQELEAGWEVNLEEAAANVGAKKESLMRLFRKLNEAGLMEYRPPFRGTEIEIIKRVPAGELAIDRAAMRTKLEHAYRKLDRIEDYVFHGDCRPRYILRYFGDEAATACRKCDNCLTIRGYARKHGHPSPEKRKKDEKPKAKLETKLTQLETFDLYNKGMNIDEMAAARGLNPETIVSHLCFLIEKGLPVDAGKFVTEAKRKKVEKAASELGADKLKPLKEALGEEIEYHEIKLALAGKKIVSRTQPGKIRI